MSQKTVFACPVVDLDLMSFGDSGQTNLPFSILLSGTSLATDTTRPAAGASELREVLISDVAPHEFLSC
jgi:hypothetical protein